MRGSGGLVALAVTLVAGCESGAELETLIESHREAAGAKLAQLEQLQASLDTMPETVDGRFVLGDRPALERELNQFNFLTYAVEDLAELARAPIAGGSEVSSTDVVASVLRALNQGTTRHSGYDDEVDRMARDFAALERARYVLVVRTVHAGQADTFGDTFVGGSFRGQVHLWDLEEGRWLGGFALEARDDRDRVTVNSNNNASATIAGNFRQMLSTAFYEGIDRATGGGVPGTSAPSGAGPCAAGVVCLGVCTCDSAGRVLTMERDSDRDGVVDNRVTYAYDEAGLRLRSETDRDLDGTPEAVTRYRYVDGRLHAEELDTNGDEQPEQRTVFAYDEAGHLLARERSQPARNAVTERCAYDPPCTTPDVILRCSSNCQSFPLAAGEPPQLTP